MRNINTPLDLCLIERLLDPRAVVELKPMQVIERISELVMNPNGAILFYGMTRVNVSWKPYESCCIITAPALTITGLDCKAIVIDDCEKGELDGHNRIQIDLTKGKRISDYFESDLTGNNM